MSLLSVDAAPQPGLSFFVAGDPAPQGSKTARPIYKGKGKDRVFTGKVSQVESSKRVKPWRETVQAAAWLACRGRTPLAGPVQVELSFQLPRPKGHWGTGRNAGVLKDGAPTWCDKKVGDLDKLIRAVLDALTDGGVWGDDCQVVSCGAEKRYADDSPGVQIDVVPIRMPVRVPVHRTLE